jgi:hypothetical protein
MRSNILLYSLAVLHLAASLPVAPRDPTPKKASLKQSNEQAQLISVSSGRRPHIPVSSLFSYAKISSCFA